VPQRKAEERLDSTQFEAACEAALKHGARVRFRAIGQSMQPNVLEGDTVIVAPLADKRLRRGDIVLARNSRGLLLHRVIGWQAKSGEAITRGDAGQEADPPPEQVLGKAVAIERGRRTISVTGIRMRLLHALRIQLRRARCASLARVRHIFSIGPLGLVFICLALLSYAPSASAQAAYTITNTANVTTIAAGQPITYSLAR
jgi:translation initiation factor IF-1